MDFTFTTEDCIEVRRQVIKFYVSIAGNGSTIPNVIDAAKPWEDVLADFQMMIYCYLFKEGMREVDRAEKISGVIHHEAKLELQRVRKTANEINCKIPFFNTEFCSNYADIDEALSERITNIVTQTYYPLLNNALRENNGQRSEVLQAIAHLITGMCFVIMACEKGMIGNHHVPSHACKELGNRICRLAATTSMVNNAGIDFDTETLEKTVTDTMNVVINLTERTLLDIMEHAKELNLEPYVASADYTKERFNHLMKANERMRTKAMLRSMRKSFVRTGGTR